MADPNQKPASEPKAKPRKPRNPGNPTGGHRQELDPKRGSQNEGGGERDNFSGEKLPKH